MKKCGICKKLKPKSEFAKNRSKADGLHSICKSCDKQRFKQYRKANREKVLEYRKQWCAANRERCLWTKAKKRAKKRGLEFNIEVSDVVIPEFCPVLGLKLEQGKGKMQASSPTLDRIDSSKGYIKGNVRVISYRANMLKNNATVEELKLLLVDAVRLERHSK